MNTQDFTMLAACRYAFTALRRAILACGMILGALCGLCIWRAKRPPV